MAEMAPELFPGRVSGGEARARDEYPDLYDAATEGRPAFKHVIQARHLARGNRAEAEVGNWAVGPLRERFGDLHGGIEKDYYCARIDGGCLLAADRTLHSILNSAPPALSAAENACKVMAREAYYGLAGDHLKAQLDEATDHAYSALTRVMAAADLNADSKVDAAAKAAAIEAARAETADAKLRIDTLLQRQARYEYFLGVLQGAPVAIALSAGVGVAANLWWRDITRPGELTAAITMAALGAVISVIQRMSNGSLVVDYTASRTQRMLLGALRPLVGAIFGAVAYCAVLSSLVASGSASTDRPSSFAFFAFVGFAAGFSERFATDLLERAGKVAGDAAQPPSGG